MISTATRTTAFLPDYSHFSLLPNRAIQSANKFRLEQSPLMFTARVHTLGKRPLFVRGTPEAFGWSVNMNEGFDAPTQLNFLENRTWFERELLHTAAAFTRTSRHPEILIETYYRDHMNKHLHWRGDCTLPKALISHSFLPAFITWISKEFWALTKTNRLTDESQRYISTEVNEDKNL